MPRKPTDKQETENQLKDAEELRSSPRDTLDTRHIKRLPGDDGKEANDQSKAF